MITMITQKSRSPQPWLVKAALCVVAVLFGCGKETPTNPGGSNPSGFTESTAQQASLTALDMIDDVVSSSESWSQGTFSAQTVTSFKGHEPLARTEGNAVYDPEQGAWVWDAQFSYIDPQDSVAVSANYWVQFRNGSGAQQVPDGTTQAMEARVTWDWNSHSQSNGSVADLDYLYATNLVVSGINTGVHHLDGAGTLTGHVSGSGPDGGTLEADVNSSWNVNLAVPTGEGCPTGTVAITAGAWSLTATYDGSSTSAWTLRLGSRVRATGTRELGCSALSTAAAVDQGQTALGAINELLAAIPQWAQSPPTGAGKTGRAVGGWTHTLAPQSECVPGDPQGAPPVFDNQQAAWTWSWSLGCQDATRSLDLNYDLWLQYRDGEGQPIMNPQGADQLEVHESVNLDAQVSHLGQSDSAQLAAQTQLTVGGLNAELYSVVGEGSLTGHAVSTGGEIQYDVNYTMAWSVDIAMAPAGGCPQGTVIVTVDQYQMHASYDGLGNVEWTLTRGDQLLASGTGDPVACGE